MGSTPNTTLPGVGTVVEDVVAPGNTHRQVVTISDRAGNAVDSIGGLTEQAPATDTAASGLNGRLQRIAQNLTTIRGSTLSVAVGDGQNVTLGARTDAKSTATDASSVSAMSVLKQISASIQSAATLLAQIYASPPSGSILALSGITAAGAGGLASTFRLLASAASTNSTNIKAAAGRLYKIHGYNAVPVPTFLKLYNKATAPIVGTDTPVKTLALPPQASFQFDWSSIGYSFTNGIGFALTTGSADNDTSAVTAGDVICLNLDYA